MKSTCHGVSNFLPFKDPNLFSHNLSIFGKCLGLWLSLFSASILLSCPLETTWTTKEVEGQHFRKLGELQESLLISWQLQSSLSLSTRLRICIGHRLQHQHQHQGLHWPRHAVCDKEIENEESLRHVFLQTLRHISVSMLYC